MRTDESREVERELRDRFPNTDAYRYNSASIRVRVVSDEFKGKSMDERDAMVSPFLVALPEEIQQDIMNLLMLFPGEEEGSLRARVSNLEFEDPTPSRL